MNRQELFNSMTNRQKSLVLADTMGWEWRQSSTGAYIFAPDGKNIVDLYDPDNMQYAWLALNWANENFSPDMRSDLRTWWVYLDLWKGSPKSSQEAWLDLVLIFMMNNKIANEEVMAYAP